ncbi:hypothetical protein [Haematospirillum jordaniae]|nr:hypothetical protein [Haematospirillum jordaniae]NKD45010.1 hypothetical protein [Haematospirillum jordaniae]
MNGLLAFIKCLGGGGSTCRRGAGSALLNLISFLERYTGYLSCRCGK